MKKLTVVILAGILLSLVNPPAVRAQSEEVQQLLLNVQKLAQLKSILDNMVKGYKVLTEGYRTIKDLSEGNFSIHKVFLDGLMAVSPTVRQYGKIAVIITRQREIVREYKSASQLFNAMDLFSTLELDYISKVYDQLIDRTLKDLDELTIIITSGQLRMNDSERLTAIDRIHDRMNEKLYFLRDFNNDQYAIAKGRDHNLRSIDEMLQLYGFPKADR